MGDPISKNLWIQIKNEKNNSLICIMVGEANRNHSAMYRYIFVISEDKTKLTSP